MVLQGLLFHDLAIRHVPLQCMYDACGSFKSGLHDLIATRTHSGKDSDVVNY